MEKLRKLAFENRPLGRNTAKGKVQIQGLKIHFPCVSLKLIKKSGILDKLNDGSYLNKPVVTIDKNTILFGELAILRYLEKDGWKGVWVDAFHSNGEEDKLWTGMPPNGIAPTLPQRVAEKFQAIKQRNGGKLHGFFDIFAWKGDGDEFLFIEYKGMGDSSNDNELKWINAAMAEGIRAEQMYIVGYDLPQ
jgi:hypothetical protein